LKHPSRYRGQQGQLWQRPDGKWVARYRENGATGKRPQRTFEHRKDGAAWLRDRLDETQQAHDGDTAILVRRREQRRTVQRAIDDYLSAVEVGTGRLLSLTKHLRILAAAFGDRPIQSIEPFEMLAWRKTVSPGYRREVFVSARQLFRQAHAWHWIASDPTAGIKNPRPRRPEVQPVPWENVLTLGEEIHQTYAALPVFGCATGLRPEEWIPLERGDLDVPNRVIRVRRVYVNGELVELGPDGRKTGLQRRNVPLRQVALEALQTVPTRIDTPLLFPPRRGRGYVHLDAFRDEVWRPALRAAGLPMHRIYDMRHTYAAESIAAGVDLFTLSRRMGTSLRQIDETYGHLVEDSAERELALLDAYDAACGRIVDAHGGV
jgi:integrase